MGVQQQELVQVGEVVMVVGPEDQQGVEWVVLV
jgi:hypothetical protein